MISINDKICELSFIILINTFGFSIVHLLYLPKSKLLPLPKSLGIHRPPLQITIQTRNNYIRIIMTVVIIYPVQRPLSSTHRFFIGDLANLSAIVA